MTTGPSQPFRNAPTQVLHPREVASPPASCSGLCVPMFSPSSPPRPLPTLGSPMLCSSQLTGVTDVSVLPGSSSEFPALLSK